MATAVIKYNKANSVVRHFIEYLATLKGVEVTTEHQLTQAEIRRVEKSRASGMGSLDELKAILKDESSPL